MNQGRYCRALAAGRDARRVLGARKISTWQGGLRVNRGIGLLGILCGSSHSSRRLTEMVRRRKISAVAHTASLPPVERPAQVQSPSCALSAGDYSDFGHFQSDVSLSTIESNLQSLCAEAFWLYGVELNTTKEVE